MAACLPMSANDPALEAGHILTVSGWGGLSAGGLGPNVLHGVQVPYITNNQCQEAYGSRFQISSNMMCAGDVAEGGINSCQGDSGGEYSNSCHGHA